MFSQKKGALLVTVPVHNRDIPRGTLISILNQARFSVEELLELM